MSSTPSISGTLPPPAVQESCQAISIRGRVQTVPALRIGGVTVITSGRLLRHAFRHDEEWLTNAQLAEPERIVSALKASDVNADIFSFSQRFAETETKYPYLSVSDNAAVIPISTYEAWWDSLPQIGRRNVRTASKKGVVVKEVPFDDQFVAGIAEIYNEAPIRLGKKFWHYGKSIETVRAENSTYLERSRFIGAFYEDRMIGFIKLVFIDRVASMMQILSMIKHQDKRTTNALIAKAVEVAQHHHMQYLAYCRYIYNANDSSLLTEFKERNGFIQHEFKRYFVPLTLKGRTALALGGHKGLKSRIPKPIYRLALNLREKYYGLRRVGSAKPTE